MNTRVGETQPRWRFLVSHGLQAGTPFVADQVKRTKLTEGFAFISGKVGNPPDETFIWEKFGGNLGYANNAPNHISPRGTTADNQAVAQIRAAIKAQQQNFSGMTFLGELRETVRSIRRPASVLFDALRKHNERLMKNAFRTPKRRAKTVEMDDLAPVEVASGLWLEFSFGVKPLLSDIKGIAETVARREHDYRHAEVRGFGRELRGVWMSEPDHVQMGYLHGSAQIVDKTEHLVVYRAGLSEALDAPAFGSARRLAELSGFNWSDIVPTLWELTPWSFLFDYFSNIGDMLSANTVSTSSVRWVNKTDILRTTREVRIPIALEYVTDPRLVMNGTGFGDSIVERKSVIRTQPTDIPFVHLEPITFPGEASKFVNMLALAASSMTKRTRAWLRS